MSVYETDLPGVGSKFDLELSDDTVASVVVHHDGRCEIYRRPNREADGEKLLDLTGSEANKLGSILEGAYFESVNLDELSAPLGDAIIEWVSVPDDSSLSEAALKEVNIRDKTGATIIAVQRDSETIPNPEPEFELVAGDILVTIGTREQQAKFNDLIDESG